MSQKLCKRCGFLPPMCRLHASGDLAHPNRIHQGRARERQSARRIESKSIKKVIAVPSSSQTLIVRKTAGLRRSANYLAKLAVVGGGPAFRLSRGHCAQALPEFLRGRLQRAVRVDGGGLEAFCFLLPGRTAPKRPFPSRRSSHGCGGPSGWLQALPHADPIL
jgi:hypothetical protein